MEYRNENEIVIYCLGRVGQHALVHWIASMCEAPVFFLNNCPFGDPYKGVWRDFSTRFNDGQNFFTKIPKLRKAEEAEISPYRLMPKHYLMYSYEHKDIRILGERDYVTDRDFTVGRSKNVYSILLIRDVFNWLADHIGKKRKGLYQLTELWEHYAREFLGETNYIKGNKICVSFNQWFQSEDYRIKIAHSLNLKYWDFTLKFQGSPDPFDGWGEYREKATELKVFDRWKILKDDRRYRKILETYPKSCELSRGIFGREIGDFDGYEALSAEEVLDA